MRQPAAPAAPATLRNVYGWVGVLTVAAALAAATTTGQLLRRRNGRFRDRVLPAQPTADAMDPVLANLGVTVGDHVTLVQFSSAFCGPCRTTRALCADVAQRLPGVRHLDVDAEAHLDAVRALDIRRTPTVLILDGQGTVRRRASGAPTRAQLVAALAGVLPSAEQPAGPELGANASAR